MIIEDIITSLERFIHKLNPKAILVILKEIEPCKFKVFKNIRYTLWLLENSRNKKYKLISILNIKKIDSPEAEENAIKEVEMEFMSILFEYIRGEKFSLVLGGSYGDYE